jgi:hypothetical protein
MFSYEPAMSKRGRGAKGEHSPRFSRRGLAAVLYPIPPAMAFSPINSGHFMGMNRADPRDNFADDAVVPSGLSVGDRYSTAYAKATSMPPPAPIDRVVRGITAPRPAQAIRGPGR